MNYINMKAYGTIETVDEFETRKEAREMLTEYRMAYGGGVHLYLSQRATRDWRDHFED